MRTDWYAEIVRLSFFVTPEWKPRSLFAEATGVAADETTARPQMMFHQEMGAVEGSYLTVGQQYGRVDFVLSDHPSAFVAADPTHFKPFAWIGKLDEALAKFEQISRNAASLVGTITRVAYALTLVLPTETAANAMKVLKENLPRVDFDPEVDRDLIYQINHVRDGAGGVMNRLARWETILSGAVQIAPNPVASVPILRGAFAARAYFDISTSAENAVPLATADLPHIIEELRSSALQLARDGDK
jgi:hypothetical protein